MSAKSAASTAVFALLALSPAGAGAPAFAQGDATSICRSFGDAYSAAAVSGDPAKVEALFAADGEWTAPQGIFKGPQALAAYISAFIKPGDGHVDKQVSGRRVGGVVLCSGDFTFTFAPGGPMKAVSGHYAKVLSKSGDGWRIVELTSNYTPPPMPQPQTQAR